MDNINLECTNLGKYTNTGKIRRWLIERFEKTFCRIVKAERPSEILDVGCGEGFLTKQLSKAMPEANIRACDLRASAIEYAEKHNGRSNIYYREGDLFGDIAGEDATCDVVVCTEVLEHLQSYEKALAILTKLAGKRVVISVPNEPWFRLGHLCRGQNILRLGCIPEHCNCWTKKGIVSLVEKYGKDIKITTETFWNIISYTPGV